MNVYTSKTHSLKVHEQQNQYYVAYTIRKKVKLANQMNGTMTSKPQMLYVHELMDQLFLLKRELVQFSKHDLMEINKIFKKLLHEN